MKTYYFPLTLLASMLLGGLVGSTWDASVVYLKPVGEIFLRVLFMAIVPLIFFSVSSAITRINSLKTLGKIISAMFFNFLLTSLVAALFMLAVVKSFPLMKNTPIVLEQSEKITNINVSDQLINLFTVNDFYTLFSHQHILALIIFALLVGIAVMQSPAYSARVILYLQAGEAIFLRFFSLIMYAAPIGFFCYFATLIHTLGTALLINYAHITMIYYLSACVYFFLVLTMYAYFAGGISKIKCFWQNIFLPVITSIATCSGIASIPANLSAAQSMRISPAVYETVMPLGAILHKEGSVMGGIMKIAFLFGLFHLDFSSFSVLGIAVGTALLVGTVMGAIPSGGMLGELLILNIYGFPPSSLMTIAAISILIDPIATMLNVTGTTANTLLTDRLCGKKTMACMPNSL